MLSCSPDLLFLKPAFQQCKANWTVLRITCSSIHGLCVTQIGNHANSLKKWNLGQDPYKTRSPMGHTQIIGRLHQFTLSGFVGVPPFISVPPPSFCLDVWNPVPRWHLLDPILLDPSSTPHPKEDPWNMKYDYVTLDLKTLWRGAHGPEGKAKLVNPIPRPHCSAPSHLLLETLNWLDESGISCLGANADRPSWSRSASENYAYQIFLRHGD